MNQKQINYAIAEMRKCIEDTYVEPCHLLTMIPKMEEMAKIIKYSPDDDEIREKLMRWIGFMQGALWAWDDTNFTIDDFRAMNTKEL